MKKLFSFVAMALLSATTFAATQYCQEPLEATDGKALLSLKHQSGNTYEVELVAQGGMKFTHAANINCGVNQSAGAGIFFENAKWVISADGLTATCAFETASEASVPTNLYANYMCFGKQGGTTARDLVEFHLDAIVDIDWTATCAEGPADTEAPVMGEASFASASYTSITLNVSATDNVAVKRYHVVTTGVDKDFLPTNEQIVITGLTAGTTYTIEVTAKDAAGNESANKATVSDAKTLSYPAPAAAPNLTNKTVLAIYADGIELAVAHKFNLNTWGGAKYDLVEKDGQNYIMYNAATNWTAWGVDNAGEEAIVGKEECKGTNGGVNASAMEYLHVDVWTDAACPSFEVLVNDTKLGGKALEGEGWHSVDLPLSAYPAEPARNWGLDNVNWMKFLGWNGVKYVGLDNVYFWKENGTTTQLEEQEVAPKVTKTIENGQLVIIRDGVKYNVVGAVIEK